MKTLTRTCPLCGSKDIVDSHFCGSCGEDARLFGLETLEQTLNEGCERILAESIEEFNQNWKKACAQIFEDFDRKVEERMRAARDQQNKEEG
jgi:hypothetical protein